MITFDLELFKKLAEEIFSCDSPTGYTDNAIKLIENYIKEYGFEYKILNNGAVQGSEILITN